MDERKKVARGLFEASGDGAIALEVMKKDLDSKAFCAEALVEAGLPHSIWVGVNDDLHLTRWRVIHLLLARQGGTSRLYRGTELVMRRKVGKSVETQITRRGERIVFATASGELAALAVGGDG